MKTLLALTLSAAVIFGAAPAYAGNSEEVIIGVLGGALGGLIVGEAIGNHRHDRIVERRVYVYDEPEYEPYCYVKKVRYYDRYRDVYVVKKRTICE